MARGKIRDDLLPHPTSIQKSRLGIREAPLEVHDQAVVGRLSAQVIWVLEVKFFVRTACTWQSVSCLRFFNASQQEKRLGG